MFKYSGEARGNDPAWRVALSIGPSRVATAWVLGLAVAGVVVAAGLPAPAGMRAPIALATVAAGYRALRRHGHCRGPAAACALDVDLAGCVEVRYADGAVRRGRLVEGSFVAPWLTIVRWRPQGARLGRTVLVVADAVDAQAFRRLRVLLRWR